MVALFALTTVLSASANPLDSPIVDQGIVVELAPYVELPDGANPNLPRARPNQFSLADDRLFVVDDIHGRIFEIEQAGTAGNASLFFDVAAAIAADTDRELDTTNSFHGGLRSVAFHPNFDSNGLFYTSVMETRPASPNPDHYLSDVSNPIIADGVVIEWRYDHVAGSVLPGSYRQVFRVGIPIYDHPIKQMTFNPFAAAGDADFGLLYVAHGDGSTQSASEGGGQNNDARGKIIRIDPTESNGQPYGVPLDNPFVGDASMLDEVFALGFRNPHHLSFAQDDAGNAHLIAVDVGRDNVEEVNIVSAGGNYGWSEREGTFVHLESGDLINGVAPLPDDDWTNGFVYPAAQYGHVGEVGAGLRGQAIAGGFVVDNGSALSGHYFYSNFPITGELYHSSFDDMLGAVTSLAVDQLPTALTQAVTGEASVVLDHDNDPTTPSLPRDSLLDVFDDAANYDGSGRADVRIGQGPNGEMYISSKRNGLVYIVTNSVPPGSSCAGRIATTNGLSGTSGDDVIIGTPGPDTIVTGGGDDIICGLGGDDTINGGPGDDWIDAGDGADTVFGLDGNDTVFAGAGNDQIVAGNNNDTIFGGDGTDTLNGGPGNDTLNGEGDRDFLFAQAGDDTINGGDGNDLILGVDGIDTINAGSGDDVVNAGPGNDTVNGGDGDDTILGLGGADILNGENGNDQIFGFPGNDVINGGQGDDQLLGNEGNDTINGNNGLDVLNGGFGNDTLDGGAGNDQLFGDADLNQRGDDTLTGGTGTDLLVGFAGNDTINAADGEQDTVNGGPHTTGDTCTVDTGAVTDTVFNCEP